MKRPRQSRMFGYRWSIVRLPISLLPLLPLLLPGNPWVDGSVRAGESLVVVTSPVVFQPDVNSEANDDEARFLEEWDAEVERDAGALLEASESIPPSAGPTGLNLFELFWQNRWWMLPILIMSFIVLAVTVERWLSLQRARVIPRRLVKELEGLCNHQYGFDPREAFRVCQRYPSAAARVVRAMLLKVGRPQSELEHAVQEASEREAQRLYSNVRWLNLASGVTPLMGLMGTVWGMIRAFHDTTQMAPGLNKAEYLAEGIYLALVTTLAGLAVAIPATILAHYFEGRVVKLFHQIDELLLNLMPQVERYEGGARFGALAAESPPAVNPSLAGAGPSYSSAPVGHATSTGTNQAGTNQAGTAPPTPASSPAQPTRKSKLPG
jgi:biopolymer transport protein ExbB